ALPKLARLAIGSCDCVGVFAMRDCLYTLRRIKLFEVGDLSTTHHPAHSTHHASHWSALLSGLRGSLFRRFFQEGEQVGALLGILDAGKRHLISGHEMLRVLSPFIECLVVPLNVCGFKGGRIAAETRHASCFSVPHFR